MDDGCDDMVVSYGYALTGSTNATSLLRACVRILKLLETAPAGSEFAHTHTIVVPVSRNMRVRCIAACI